MPSGKFHTLVGMQDTEKAMKHARLVCGRAKTAVLTYKLETARAFSIAGKDSPFLYLVRFFFVSFYEHIPLSSPLIRFASASTNEGEANGSKSVS